MGHVPRMSMGRNRWGAMPAAGGGEGMDLATLSGVRQLTPEAREVASRTYVAGALFGVGDEVAGGWIGGAGLAAGCQCRLLTLAHQRFACCTACTCRPEILPSPAWLPQACAPWSTAHC